MMKPEYIISLTTLPSRFSTLKEVLWSLDQQIYNKPFEVHLNIPRDSREGSYDHDLSDFKFDNVKIFDVKDRGSTTKIYNTLLRTFDPEQKIVIVDDDFTYHPAMLSEYDRLFQDYPYLDDCAIGFAGIYPFNKPQTGKLDFVGPVQEPTRCGLLEGYKSICFKRKFFGEYYLDSYYKAHYNDDLTISSYLGNKGIHKYCVPFGMETNFNVRMLSFPLSKPKTHGKTGVAQLRDPEGGSEVSYKKFYNSINGKGLKE